MFKIVNIEFGLSLSQDHLAHKILRRQETDEPVMFVSVRIHDQDRRGPFDIVSVHQRLVLFEVDLEGNKALLD